MFVFDNSGSTEASLEIAMQIARKVIARLNFAGSRTRVGAAIYSNLAEVSFHLNKYNNQQGVLNAVVFDVTNKRTNTQHALQVSCQFRHPKALVHPRWNFFITTKPAM